MSNFWLIPKADCLAGYKAAKSVVQFSSESLHTSWKGLWLHDDVFYTYQGSFTFMLKDMQTGHVPFKLHDVSITALWHWQRTIWNLQQIHMDIKEQASTIFWSEKVFNILLTLVSNYWGLVQRDIAGKVQEDSVWYLTGILAMNVWGLIEAFLVWFLALVACECQALGSRA